MDAVCRQSTRSTGRLIEKQVMTGQAGRRRSVMVINSRRQFQLMNLYTHSACFRTTKCTSLPNGFSVSSMGEALRLSIFSELLASGPEQHIRHKHIDCRVELAVLPDNRYVCDCCMGLNLGIPCRHYFQPLTVVKAKGLWFHIGLVRARY